MLKSISLICISVIVYFLDGSVLKKNRMSKELWVFFTLLSLGVLVGCLQFLHVFTWSPLQVVEFLFGPLSRGLNHWLT